ncbi:hypothetical protein HYN59_14390 [Flavobacterium album]|uniref:Uncharacterized protein n=1 Tax=Flavobacterium album TaxID=2175091 RepID=A0A2S1R0R7_9FLAO|nr:hypothetical protein [Flavobacterium album]AWH86225.1 hypothetical protein HYN59_14390 [Flavobacterium album]
MKLSYYILIAAFFIITGCKKTSEAEEVSVLPATDTIPKPVYDGYDGDRQAEDTRIVYPSFEVVFHGFAGYDVDRKNGKLYGDPDDVELRLANNGLKEALIAKKDTVMLGESPEYTTENKLLEIISKNQDDKFKVSMYYTSSLNEVFNDRGLSTKEIEKAYENADKYNEITKEIALRDSLGFFRTITLESSTDEAFEKEKKFNPGQHYYDEDLNRVKRKYNINDTVVLMNGGDYGDRKVTLVRKGRLFEYTYDSYIIKIERYNKGQLAETKYIEIMISYGC